MSTADFSPLFNPIKIGKVTLKNRIVMAPMCSRLPTADDELIHLEADTVVPAWGFRPDHTFNEIAEEIAPSTPFIGDCVRLGNLRSCVWPGFMAAYEI